MKSGAGSNHSSNVSALTEHDYIGLGSEVSSSNSSSSDDRQKVKNDDCFALKDDDLCLGLGLSTRSKKDEEHRERRSFARFLTAEDLNPRSLPSVDAAASFGAQLGLSSASSGLVLHGSGGGCSSHVSGTKRGFDVDDQPLESDTPKDQAVGWPPIGLYRSKIRSGGQSSKSPLYVKVNMDGVPIGRKVDLNAHDSYETLALALEDMFQRTPGQNGGAESSLLKGNNAVNRSRLLDGISDFVLTYEDKEGDWMLVGDVPWRMFVSTVKRLRILKTSDVNALAPKCPERTDRQKNRIL